MQYNIAIYTRISREDENDKESESIINQKNIIKNFIDNDVKLSKGKIFYYSDDGYSGSNFNRPNMNRLTDDMKKGKINCIIVKDLSRFGRNYIQVSDYLDKIFPFFNIRFIAICDNYDSLNNKNCTNDLDISFKNILYSYYLKDIALKSKSAKIVKAKQGCHMSFAPFGYKKNTITKRLEIDEKQAKIVRLIFNLLDETNSPTEVCKILNEQKISTISSFKNNTKINKSIWKVGDIRQIIKNEVYIGNTVNFKVNCKNFGSKKRYIKTSEDEIIRVVGTHQPIIEKDLFIKLNSKKNIIYTRDINKKTIFAYKLKCGCCGYGLKYYQYSNNLRKYYCNSWKVDESLECSRNSICEEDLKNIVIESLKKQLLIYLQKNEVINNEKELQNDVLLCNKNIENFNDEKANLYENYLEKNLTKDEYVEKKKELDNLIFLNKEKIENLEKQLCNLKHTCIENLTLKKYLKTEVLTREIVENFVDKILILDNNSIRIIWKFLKS